MGSSQHNRVWAPPSPSFTPRVRGWKCYDVVYFDIEFSCLQLTYMNLNFMMCPAPNDPFGGPYYRAMHIVLMSFLLIGFGKIYFAVSLRIIRALSSYSKRE
jgi:hypothetical protein